MERIKYLIHLPVKRLPFFICILLASSFILYSQNSVIDYGNNSKAGRFATVNGIELYYETYGNGSPLLLFHGNGGSINNFRNQIPFFEKYFRIIAIDSRLQGKSGGSSDTISYNLMVSDFNALLDKLNIDSAYVIGWSDGGIDGLILAMNFSKRVKKLAISGANIVPDSTAISASFIYDMKKLVADGKATKRDIALNKMMIYEPNIPFEELKKISCPVLVMAGDHDIILPEHSLKIFQWLPHAQLCIFPNSNHDVCILHPQLFNETVLRFFEE